MLFTLIVLIATSSSLLLAQAADTAPDQADAIPGWPEVEAVRENIVDSGGFLDFSLGWVVVFFIISGALMLWLAWQNRGGGMWRGGGTEKIELVAKRMFGSKHGVVCVRLRDREFFLGIGGDNVTMISEWRRRPDDAPDEEVLHGYGRKTASEADSPGGDSQPMAGQDGIAGTQVERDAYTGGVPTRSGR